jgi:signal peptidase II
VSGDASARAGSGGAPAPEASVPRRRFKVLAVAIVLVGVGLDLWTKDWMYDYLQMDAGRPDSTLRKAIVPGFLGLEGTWNTGVTFGFARGQTEWILAFTVVAILALFAWLLTTRVQGLILHLGLAFVLAGALGNLYDRWIWHSVRDFILVHLGDIEKPTWRWPNFNVADSLIVVGVSFILWEELFGRRRRSRLTASPLASASPTLSAPRS